MLIYRLWLWLLLKIYKIMDCNSTEINEGLNGYNSYTYTTATFVIPAINNATPVTINVSNVRPSTGVWAAVGSYIFVNGNYLLVVSATENTITVTNPTTATNYTTNQAPGSVVPSNSLVITAGIQGPQGNTPIVPEFKESGVIYFDNTRTVNSVGYFQLQFLNIENLVNNNDVLEVESVIRYTDSTVTTLGGYKFQVDGNDVQEYTSGDLIDSTDVKYILHKMSITRISPTAISIRSLIESTDSSGLISTSSSQQYLFTSPTVSDVESLPIRFLLRNSNLTQVSNQVVIQLKYIPFIA
jgi:hypothetical protein